MTETRTLGICALVFATLGLSSGALCRRQSDEVPSLGTVARKLKAERARQKRQPVKVYTNDSLRRMPAPQTEPGKTTGPEAGEPSKEEAATAPPAKHPKEYGEKYFRSEADNIRTRMRLHQGQLAVLEQKLSLSSTEYYANPQKTLQQESTPTFHGDVNKLRAQIDATKQQISDDQKAMDDLRDELRRKGGDPGWIRQ
ncbi:MAG TPA: hypothetical protein VMW54_12665 [Terriglobia bacterium]|nr:hypothetical protein [Terriglobia bacterium]